MVEFVYTRIKLIFSDAVFRWPSSLPNTMSETFQCETSHTSLSYVVCIALKGLPSVFNLIHLLMCLVVLHATFRSQLAEKNESHALTFPVRKRLQFPLCAFVITNKVMTSAHTTPNKTAELPDLCIPFEFYCRVPQLIMFYIYCCIPNCNWMELNTPNVKSLNAVCLFALSPAFSMLTRPALRLRRLAAHLCEATMSTNHSSSSLPSPASGKAATAAILIIGDEILKVCYCADIHMKLWCVYVFCQTPFTK